MLHLTGIMLDFANLVRDLEYGREIIYFLSELRTEAMYSETSFRERGVVRCDGSMGYDIEEFIKQAGYILDPPKTTGLFERLSDTFKDALPFLGNILSEYDKIREAADLIKTCYNTFKDRDIFKKETIEKMIQINQSMYEFLHLPKKKERA